MTVMVAVLAACPEARPAMDEESMHPDLDYGINIRP